jgi:hypothetical protein
MKEELINDLYLQSQIQRDTEWGENVTFFDYRKFAQLIVEECLSVVDDETKGHWDTRIEIFNDIMKHFGVK